VSREIPLENCAYGTGYASGKLEAFFKADPAAKARLDAVRESILRNVDKNL
jgi:hypothetical protein